MILKVLIGLVGVWVAFAASAEAEEVRGLGVGTYPLVDRYLIKSMRGASHALHGPVRREVVLTLDKPWEGKMSAYGTAVRDPDGKVRIYYRGGGDVDPPEVTCVAVSEDGVSFKRPVLGQFRVRGTRENNVVFTADRKAYGESHNFSPFVDTNPAATAEVRWKAVALKTDTDEQGKRQRMLTVLGSADGFKWKAMAERPVIRRGGFDSLNVAFFDEARGEYACYFRVGIEGRRSFARALSKDFLKWTIDQPLEFLPGQDEQWYTNGVTKYPGVRGLYLAMPMRFVPERKTVGEAARKVDGVSDAVLMSSRDGRTWDRTFREAFIRPGPDDANWGNAHGNNTPLTGVVETGNGEWSVYWFEGYGAANPRIRRGTVRANGLASVHAGAERGEMVTPLLRMTGGAGATLCLNYATSAVGSIRVEVLGKDEKPFEGFGEGDCQEIYGDEPVRAVVWRGGKTLPAGAVFRLRFLLKDADLYALTLR